MRYVCERKSKPPAVSAVVSSSLEDVVELTSPAIRSSGASSQNAIPAISASAQSSHDDDETVFKVTPGIPYPSISHFAFHSIEGPRVYVHFIVSLKVCCHCSVLC